MCGGQEGREGRESMRRGEGQGREGRGKGRGKMNYHEEVFKFAV